MLSEPSQQNKFPNKNDWQNVSWVTSPLMEVLEWRNFYLLQEKIPSDGYRHSIPIGFCWLWMTISFVMPVDLAILWIAIPDIVYSFRRENENSQFISDGNAFMRAWKIWTLMLKKDDNWVLQASFVSPDIWMEWSSEINLENIASISIQAPKASG